MSIGKLQEKIRKTKNPIAVDFDMQQEHIPVQLLESIEGFLPAYQEYVQRLLETLKGTVPAVRFHFGMLAALGAEGLRVLSKLAQAAKTQGYYVFLDGVEALSAQSAKRMADVFLTSSPVYFDGLIITAYIGSDAIAPYAAQLKEAGKVLFVVARTANRSAPDVQDLLTGSRLVHVAKVDIANRYAQPLITKCGYSQVALVAAASSADSIRLLRSKYPHLFMLLDGYDYPNANAKNCSFAFDSLGHGALACVGTGITAAWREDQEVDYLEAAVCAAEKYKKNLSRYITVL